MEIIYLFLTAFFVAYLLEPICKKLVNLGFNKSISSFFSILFGLLIFVMMMMIALPILDTELIKLKSRLPEMISNGYLEFKPLFEKILGPNIEVIENFKLKAIEWLKSYSGALSKLILKFLVSGTNLLMTLIGWIVIIPVSIFYLLRDWDSFFSKILFSIPKKYQQETAEIITSSDIKLKLYLKGQLLVMFSMAIYYTICLAFVGFESWFSLGIISGLLLILPYVGFAIAFAMSSLAGILDLGLIYGLIFTSIIFGIGQILEGFFLTPKLVGESIGLHPLAVIFSLLFFGGLFGFVGLLIALPLTAILSVMIIKILKKADFNI